MKPTANWLAHLAVLPLLLVLAEVLAGCGGGDPEPESHTGPPDCQARPEVCR